MRRRAGAGPTKPSWKGLLVGAAFFLRAPSKDLQNGAFLFLAASDFSVVSPGSPGNVQSVRPAAHPGVRDRELADYSQKSGACAIAPLRGKRLMGIREGSAFRTRSEFCNFIGLSSIQMPRITQRQLLGDLSGGLALLRSWG